MILLLVSLCVGLCVSNVVVPSYHGDEAWGEYKQQFGKIYTSESEEQMRYQVWKNEINEISLHNALYGHQYQQGVNHLTDMTDEEYEKYSTGLSSDYDDIPELTSNPHVPQNNAQLPDTVDWRDKGYVTGVKNQGHCGSCYSFGATGSLEGAWMKKTGKLVSLSEQQIVDCSGRYGNMGCNGGWYQWAWIYLERSGSELEQDYPYEAVQRTCRFNADKVAVKVTGYHNIHGGEAALQEAVANVGPVAVAIDAHPNGFRRYKSGVFYDPNCSSTKLTHAVLAVGYGSEEGQDYWLVKNSWGGQWGADGFIKMARNKNNHCGIATRPAYPKV